MTTPDALRRANIAALCNDPELVARIVDKYEALQRELEEARAVVTAAKVAEHKIDQAMQGRSGALSAALWILRDAIAVYDEGANT